MTASLGFLLDVTRDFLEARGSAIGLQSWQAQSPNLLHHLTQLAGLCPIEPCNAPFVFYGVQAAAY